MKIIKMVYPDSPFTDKFNTETIISLKYFKNDNIIEQESYNLLKLIQWLCQTPKVSSFRINTLKTDIQTIKQLLQAQLELVAAIQGKSDCMPKLNTHHQLNDVLLVNSYPEDKLDLFKQDKEIIVDADCGAAVLRGAQVFAPGVLAMQPETKIGDRVSIFVDRSKNCKKGYAKIYECSYKLFIANGTVKMSRKELFKDEKQPVGVAIQITDTLSGCPSINETNLPRGAVVLQNIPSIVCGHVLNPKMGEIVLDMCAAPGNKTSHIAALMQNQGIIIALDKTPQKLKLLEKTIENYGLSMVQAYCFDSTKSYDANNKNSDLKPPFSAEIFDKILLDAPCSGLGNRPQLLNKITDKIAKSYVPLQIKLISNAAQLLKKGGELVYSTCSISLEENEGIVSWALDKFKFLELVDSVPKLGGPGWLGTNLSREEMNFVQRFGPEGNCDSIGFFIAKFRKKM